jgi:hypothetical protein
LQAAIEEEKGDKKLAAVLLLARVEGKLAVALATQALKRK